MKLAFIRFMLYSVRFEHALAILGNNRHLAAQARRDEIHWEAERDRELLLRHAELY